MPSGLRPAVAERPAIRISPQSDDIADLAVLDAALQLWRPRQWRIISPTPTLRFFLTDSSAVAASCRVVGPST